MPDNRNSTKKGAVSDALQAVSVRRLSLRRQIGQPVLSDLGVRSADRVQRRCCTRLVAGTGQGHAEVQVDETRIGPGLVQRTAIDVGRFRILAIAIEEVAV